jgi:hypothetical protein
MGELLAWLFVICLVIFAAILALPFAICAFAIWGIVLFSVGLIVGKVLCGEKYLVRYAQMRFDGRELSGKVDTDQLAQLVSRFWWWAVEIGVAAIAMIFVCQYLLSSGRETFGKTPPEVRIFFGSIFCLGVFVSERVRSYVVGLRKDILSEQLLAKIARISGPLVDARDLADDDRRAAELLERLRMPERESWVRDFASFIETEHAAIMRDQTAAKARLDQTRSEAKEVVAGLERAVVAHDSAQTAYEFALRDVTRSGSAALIQGIEQAYAMLHSDNMRGLIESRRFDEYVAMANALATELSDMRQSAQAYRENPQAFEEESEQATGGSEALSRADALALLGMFEEASRDEITRAWRSAMKAYNVDQRQDLPKDAREFLENRLKRINQAKEILLPRSTL